MFFTGRGRRKAGGLCQSEAGNYVDFMYLHPDFQGKGIAGAMLNYTLEARAILAGCKTLLSDVSYTARPFFEKHGFRVVKKNLNERKGEVLVNFMWKRCCGETIPGFLV
ncbi:MAG: GNAT family N-acetyltransferase [Bacteroidia bacterium]